MKKREKPVVGQELWLVESFYGKREPVGMACKVVSVGRKYFRVDSGRGWKDDGTRFINETWVRDTGYPVSLYESEQEYLEFVEYQELQWWLRRIGNLYLSMDQMRRIKAIAEEGN